MIFRYRREIGAIKGCSYSHTDILAWSLSSMIDTYWILCWELLSLCSNWPGNRSGFAPYSMKELIRLRLLLSPRKREANSLTDDLWNSLGFYFNRVGLMVLIGKPPKHLVDLQIFQFFAKLKMTCTCGWVLMKFLFLARLVIFFSFLWNRSISYSSLAILFLLEKMKTWY